MATRVTTTAKLNAPSKAFGELVEGERHTPMLSAEGIGAVAFIHRFGALLNPHEHFHCVVVDGVFEAGTGGDLPVRFHETPVPSEEQLAERLRCAYCRRCRRSGFRAAERHSLRKS